MAANKYKGKDLSFLVDGEEQKMEIISAVLQPEDGEAENTTFGELGEGDSSNWFMQVTAVADYGAGSFWSFCWDNAGEEVPYRFDPYGVGSTATTTKPVFTGELSVKTPPQIGGTAGENFTFEIRLDCTGRPERVTS